MINMNGIFFLHGVDGEDVEGDEGEMYQKENTPQCSIFSLLHKR